MRLSVLCPESGGASCRLAFVFGERGLGPDLTSTRPKDEP